MKFKKSFSFEILLSIFFVNFENAESFLNVYPRIKRSELTDNDTNDPGTPLFLTPLINSGNIDDARNQAKVEHPKITNTTSYAGYFTVNEKYNSNLFFWFFPAKVNSSNAPVVLYLEGGPGASALFGLFMYNGPFEINEMDTVKLRDNSWSNRQNLIYIDSPVGTGFSFTENNLGYARNQTQIGQELRIALVQFFKLFPHLRNNDFFVIGESYAGKFVPVVCHEIHRYNPTNLDDSINLKGMAISSGLTDPINQMIYGDHLYEIGLIDDNGRNEFYALEKKFRDSMINKQYDEALTTYEKFIDNPTSPATLFRNLTGYMTDYNMLRTNETAPAWYTYKWLNSSSVRSSLHVGNVSLELITNHVAEYLRQDFVQSQAHLVADLLDHYKVLIYSGNLDIVVSYSTVCNYLKHLKWSGAEEYKKAARKQWIVDDELAGYVKTVGNLTEVLVRNAGHFIALDQSKWTLNLTEEFTMGQMSFDKN